MLLKCVPLKFLLCSIISFSLSSYCQASEDKENCALYKWERLIRGVEKFYDIQNQTQLDETVSKLALNIYEEINKNWKYPEKDLIFSTDSTYWEVGNIEISEGKLAIPVLKNKNLKETRLLDALWDLACKPAVLECRIAQTLTNNIILGVLLGGRDLNFFAQTLYEYPGKAYDKNRLFDDLVLNFFKFTNEKKKEYSVSIVNIPSYLNFVKNGYSQGQNVLCVEVKDGNNKYIGFGSEFKNGPLTENEIEMNFYRELFDKGEITEGQYKGNKFSKSYKYTTYILERKKFQFEKDKKEIHSYFYFDDLKSFLELE